MTSSSCRRVSVTFVFTDIEGSTQPAAPVGRRVRRRARAAPARRPRGRGPRSGGVEVSVDGDACFVAFASADAAMAGCTAAQQALARQTWPEGGDLRVRDGHAHRRRVPPRRRLRRARRPPGGPGRARRPRRPGPRLAGHRRRAAGGTARRRRADRPRPLPAAGLRRARWRSTRSAAATAGSRPCGRSPPTSTTSRRPARRSWGGPAELDEIGRRLRPGRAVTIVGMGGVGKTRLATEIGVRVAPAWADGRVDGRPVERSPTRRSSASTVADGARRAATGADRDSDDPRRTWPAWQAVLVLDNCEQVIEACADVRPRRPQAVLRRSPCWRRAASRSASPGEVRATGWPRCRSIDDAVGPVRRPDRRHVGGAGATAPTIERHLRAAATACPLAIELAASQVRGHDGRRDPRRPRRALPPAAQRDRDAARAPAHDDRGPRLELRPARRRRAHGARAAVGVRRDVRPRRRHRRRRRRRRRRPTTSPSWCGHWPRSRW